LWDIAAGSFLVKEAGGKVSEPKRRDNIVEFGNILASNALLYEALLNKLAS